ncbi:LacI family transcriptional regulator [Limosilactobacillus reuteri]|uniref:LacI family transcriptional regulator n=1 Tax=Limosilactobacillus reuteri TaxID=1598 RepID=A0A317GI85_LIMRT|nr:LacI family DNA-binding transcriptional regulator [Limosilactobacillus reuteri]MCH5385865.1 LacI family transcriptional regulator [Limosilactobacillus reuteri]PWT46732.1 LacI family transcriptional regulator [Limosilactobacillus reuteri]PWT51232.1 LacI family transcriptional regulator [Limosilactobacillus reuteri]PWT62146.1 LacI family transcriptional regulator [Limosilactobacillus reuteri]
MATIKDIAQKTGVSVSTASRALNHNPRISEKTRQRIAMIAKELGYQPNYNAQNLTRGESNMVGIIFPVTSDTAPANPFHIDLLWGISVALKPIHYEMVVVIALTTTDLLQSVKSMVEQSKVHNFLVLYIVKDDPITNYLRQNNLNFVVIGHPDKAQDRFVDIDNVAAGRAATDYLMDHQRVSHPIFLQSASNWVFEQDRYQGYEQSMQNHQLPALSWRYSPAGITVKDFIKQHPQIDSIVCADDLLLVRLKRQLQEFNLPTICFNNSRLMGMLINQEEKVDLQPRKLGQQAVELLFNPEEKFRIVDFKINS